MTRKYCLDVNRYYIGHSVKELQVFMSTCFKHHGSQFSPSYLHSQQAFNQTKKNQKPIHTTEAIGFMDPVVFRGDVCHIEADAAVLEMTVVCNYFIQHQKLFKDHCKWEKSTVGKKAELHIFLSSTRWSTRTMISAWNCPGWPASWTLRWNSRETSFLSVKMFPPSTPSTLRRPSPTWPFRSGTPNAWAPSPLISAPQNPTGWSSSPTGSRRTGGTQKARRTTRWTSLRWSCWTEGCTCCWTWVLAPSRWKPHRQRSMMAPGTMWTSRGMDAQVRMEGESRKELAVCQTHFCSLMLSQVVTF